ncbi:hypothetical protein ATM17_12565 [Sphingopyxis macrogoltabida]|uniref:Uncharacterized protein n=1 Tax=Sphingopyxis macrogoltabida TaxID=33050 RepID=A0AAC9FFL8_SPHMC|nr:hypothetical protein LH19_07270 [Sphingopyxis macrogoltabida]AMU89868.1 hypothetical protein ATM17_12565 [Sphingopyxis macrogoltabida]
MCGMSAAEIARETLNRIGWHLELRSGIRCKVEDCGGVGAPTPSELVMFLALTAIATPEPHHD